MAEAQDPEENARRGAQLAARTHDEETERQQRKAGVEAVQNLCADGAGRGGAGSSQFRQLAGQGCRGLLEAAGVPPPAPVGCCAALAAETFLPAHPPTQLPSQPAGRCTALHSQLQSPAAPAR